MLIHKQIGQEGLGDNIKYVNSIDFFSFIASVSYNYLYLILSVIGILIIIINMNAKDRETEAQRIEKWEPLSILKYRKCNCLYLKLAIKYLKGLITSKPLCIYSEGHGRFALYDIELNRLNNAAILA